MNSTSNDIHGIVAPGFEGVRDAFEENFAQRSEVGAGLTIYRSGEPVVDLWGGVADSRSGAPWQRDTLVLIYSATKGAAATVVNILAERGEFDLDAPVVSYWPQFAAGGKETITARTILAHREGLPVIEGDLDLAQLFDGRSAAAQLATQRPLWQPGTAHGYHGLTFGWLVSEVVARATGKRLGVHFAELVASPLGLDFFIGTPDSAEARIATQVTPDPFDPATLEAISDRNIRDGVIAAGGQMIDPSSVIARSLNPCGVLPTPDPGIYAERVVHAIEQPAVNGISTAHSLARMYAACIGEVDGTRLLSEAALSGATQELSSGPDQVLTVPSRFSSGYMLRSPICEMMSDSSFGHVGAGGALGFADTDSGIAFGYAQSKLGTAMVGDARTNALIEALRAAL